MSHWLDEVGEAVRIAKIAEPQREAAFNRSNTLALSVALSQGKALNRIQPWAKRRDARLRALVHAFDLLAGRTIPRTPQPGD